MRRKNAILLAFQYLRYSRAINSAAKSFLSEWERIGGLHVFYLVRTISYRLKIVLDVRNVTFENSTV